MLLERGTPVLVVHRRLFEGDRPRYFVGFVEAGDADVILVTGHSWVQDTFNGTFLKKEDPRTKVLSLTSGTLFVYRLPPRLDPARLVFSMDEKGALWLRDGSGWKMDLSEHCQSQASRGRQAPRD
jgi:hypothetical protein